MAGYAFYDLSLFDNAYSPRYYMGVMFALPFDTWHRERLRHAKDNLRAAAVRLTEIIPGLLADVMIDPKNGASGRLVLGFPISNGQHVRDPTFGIGSFMRFIEHDDWDFAYSALEEAGFRPSSTPLALFSPFPKIPDPTMAHSACGIQVNVVRGALVVVFCLHHAFADGSFARDAVNVFLGILSGKSYKAPHGLVYSLPKLEGELEVVATRKLFKDCPERFIKPTEPIDIPPPNHLRSFMLAKVHKPVPSDIASIAHLRLSGPLLVHLKATVLATLSRLTKESDPPVPEEIKAIARTISTNDAAAAFVWAHLAAARSANRKEQGEEDEGETEKTYRLFMPIDVRRRIEPASAIPNYYVGNAVLTVSTSIPLSFLLAARDGLRTPKGAQALSEVALAIRMSVLSVDDSYIRTHLTLAKSVLAEWGDIRKLGLDINLEGGRDTVFNNLAFLNVEAKPWNLGGVFVKPVAVRRMLPGAKVGVCTAFAACGEVPNPKVIGAMAEDSESEKAKDSESGKEKDSESGKDKEKQAKAGVAKGTKPAAAGKKAQEAWEIEVVLKDKAMHALEGMKSWMDAVAP